MNVVMWADKGGTGKTTIATNLSLALGAPLLDLDPQSDAARWADHRGLAAIRLVTPREVQEALFTKGLKIIDCPPGQGPVAMSAVALADLLVIPTRTGDADMVALGRTMDVVRKLRTVRSLQVGLVLNLARETGRARGIETALRSQAGPEYQWLGRMSARVGVEEAYSSGVGLLQVGGAVAYEFRQVLSAVESLVSTESNKSPESYESVL
jgi:chromosome partitioning protein